MIFVHILAIDNGNFVLSNRLIETSKVILASL